MSSLLQYLLFGFFLPLFLSLYYLLIWKPKNTKNNTRIAPEAAGAWPIIGHLHLLGGTSIPHITLGAMADKYGPAFTIRFGMHRALVVSDKDVAKECFTTNDKALSFRAKSIAIKLMGYNYAMFGFNHGGRYWHEVHKLVMRELLSNRRLDTFKHVRASEVEGSIKDLYKRCLHPNPVLVDMKKWFGDLMLNIILRIVAGKRYSETDTSYDLEQKLRCQEVIRGIFYLAGLFVISDAIPFLEGFDLQGYEREMKRMAKNMDNILQGWLEEHQQKRSSASSNKAKDEQDFMDVMISTMEDSKLLDDYDADTVIKATCLNMIISGSDSTAITLIWALSLLLNNQHALKRAKDELDMHVGRDRQVNESDISKLEYLQAIIKETFRLYPVGPLIPRVAMEECTIAGYHVAVGTRILTNISKIHRDPRVWSDPHEFQPERFLTSHTDVDVWGKHFEFLPFGSGRRMCPGVPFALQVLHLTLAHLIHGFEIENPLGKPVDMTESAGMTNIKATPLEVLLSPRLSSKLYE